MTPCGIIIVEKKRWLGQVNNEGVSLIIVDLSNNATLFVYYV